MRGEPSLFDQLPFGDMQAIGQQLSAAPSPAPVGINGLTEAETNASASVMGLVKKENQ